MADDYIDYLECLEYGDHFLTQVDSLAGASKLVDIAVLKNLVTVAMAGVGAELDKQGIKRSSVRVDRVDVAYKTAALRKILEKFYHHAAAQEDGAFDIEAFFEGGNQGGLSALKPSDIAQKAAEVLRGFSVPANASFPDATNWQLRIENAQAALVSAIAGKSSSTADNIKATADLIAARQAFLVAYNGIAKRLVQAMLINLGRKDDLRLYFKDLQVDESRFTKVDATQPGG
jgi:hypothetical protein